MNTSTRYAAFISYRHKPRDRQWAIRIMQMLEAYRTPQPMRAEAFPARIGTLFRDEDEISASGDLSDRIKQALECSEFLIVICTPETPGSRWVRREIELFQEMGKGDRVLALLVAGEPDESFPPELKRKRVEGFLSRDGSRVESALVEIEPIAADVRPRTDESRRTTEERALLRLAATLLGCRFDDLAQRELEKRRRIFRTRLTLSSAVLAVSIVAGVAWWDQTIRIKTEHCSNFGERWGVPFCIGKLTSVEQRRRHESWRFTLQGGKVLQLARINGAGSLVDIPDADYGLENWQQGVAQWSYSYLENRQDSENLRRENQPASVKMYGKHGELVRQFDVRFSEDGSEAVVKFEKLLGEAERLTATAAALSNLSNRNTGKQRNRTTIGQHRLRFDPRGHTITRLYEPVGGGSTTPDEVGAHGRGYDVADSGLIMKIRNLNAIGETLTEKRGVVAMIQRFDPRGDLTEVSWLDANGFPKANSAFLSRISYVRDRYGNIVEKKFYNTSGNTTTIAHISKIVAIYDTQGNKIEERFLDSNGSAVLSPAFGAAQVISSYDSSGYLVAQSFRGTDGEPLLRTDNGAAFIHLSYDEIGRQVRETYLDTNRKATYQMNSHISTIIWRYDTQNRKVEERYTDPSGALCINAKTGAAITRFRYDTRGNKIEVLYLGIDESLIVNKRFGAARITWTHDVRGNAIAVNYFGTDNKPVLTKGVGAARIATKYDERGNLVEERYLGLSDDLVLDQKTGAAVIAWEYDEYGNVKAESSYGIDGKPVLTVDFGVARANFKYDANGDIVEESVFGIDGRPILRKDRGVFKTITIYDRGAIVAQKYLGTDERPIRRSDWSVASLAAKYDDNGNVIESKFFDLDGLPAQNAEWGAARVVWFYDERDRLVEQSSFGVDGKLTPHKIWGVARTLFKYDDYGNNISQAYFGANGGPVLSDDRGIASIEIRYDERSRKIEEANFGSDGQLILNNDGVARTVFSYDKRGNESAQIFYDTVGNLIENKRWGAARVGRIFDDRDNPIEYSTFGRDGSLVVSPSFGRARTTFDYDGRNNNTETAYFGEYGEPILVDGVSKIKWNFDQQGYNVGTTYYDAEEKLVDSTFGFATSRAMRDRNGNLIDVRYFNRLGSPSLRANRFRQDEALGELFGNFSEHVLRGVFDETIYAKLGEGGFAHVVQEFDDRGNVVRRAYFGLDGRVITGFEGVGEVQIEYDDLNRPTEFRPITFVGNTKRPNQVWTRLHYDDAGNIVRLVYIDENKQLTEGAQGVAFVNIEWNTEKISIYYKDLFGKVVAKQ